MPTAGLTDLQVDEGPFEMMSPKGFVADEGVARTLTVMRCVVARPAYMKMPRMRRAVSYLGYIVVAGQKPS